MTYHLPGMRDPLTREQATRLLTADQIQDHWRTCQSHQVTTCPCCARLWRLDQLTHPSQGAYAGEIDDGAQEDGAAARADTRSEIPTGIRYAYTCSDCGTDLTDLVCLHVDACRLTQRRERQ